MKKSSLPKYASEIAFVFWLQNEKFPPSKLISHSFDSLTIEQITISILDVEQNHGYTVLEIGPAPQLHYHPAASFKELGFSP